MISLDEVKYQWLELLPEAQVLGVSGPFPVQEIRSVLLPAGYPLLVIDGFERHHLLLPVADDALIVRDQNSAGVQLLSTDWREDQRSVRVADMVCLKPHLNDLFDLIIVDVLNGLIEESFRPDVVGRRVLSRWRDLLSREPGQIPERGKVIGLLGELMMLRQLVEVHNNALDVWTGPTGSRHDFVGWHASIEVKSTLQRHGLTLTINGVDQLMPPDGGELHLVVLRFEEAPQDGQSIADLVEDLMRLGVDQAEVLIRTASTGFPLDVIIGIKDQKFRLLESRQYAVNSSFPRIVPTSFTGGTTPNGVVSLSYEIDLSVTPPFPLSTDQAVQFIDEFIKR